MEIKEKLLKEIKEKNVFPYSDGIIRLTIDLTLAEVKKKIDDCSEFVYSEYEGDKHINSVGLIKLKKEIGINQDASGRKRE